MKAHFILDEDIITKIIKKNFKVAKKQIEDGKLNVNKPSGEFRMSPLHIAAKFNPPLVPILVDNGAIIDMMDRAGRMPLHYAAKFSPSVIKYLVDEGTINHKDKNGETPLFIAIRSKMTESVKELIALGADVEIKDKKGLNAKQLASSYGFKISKAIKDGLKMQKVKHTKQSSYDKIFPIPSIKQSLLASKGYILIKSFENRKNMGSGLGTLGVYKKGKKEFFVKTLFSKDISDPKLKRETDLVYYIKKNNSMCGEYSNNVLVAEEIIPDKEEIHIVMKKYTSDLFKYRTRVSPKNIRLIVVMMIRILQGIMCLHKMNIVHGDLKPENIFVEYDSDRSFRELVIADYDCSRILNTHEKTLCATPHYLPPEAYSNGKFMLQNVGMKGDIYSIGKIFGEFFIKYDFDIHNLERSHLNFVRAVKSSKNIPKLFKILILQMVDLNPKNRPRTESIYNNLKSYYNNVILKKILAEKVGERISNAISKHLGM